jgi:hypothetical protein
MTKIKNQKEREVLQETWENCYNDSWKSLIVPGAFAH